MSTHIDSEARQPPRADDDDWFAAAQPAAAEPEEPAWEPELEWELRETASPDVVRRHAGIVLAVGAAVLLVLAGILLGRATKSSSTTVVTVTAASQDEGATAGTGTTAGSTGSTGSTGTSTTGADTTADTTKTETTATGTGSTSPSTGTGTGTTAGTGTTSENPNAVPTDATLRPGDKGASVIALQKGLTTLGFTPGTADGTYGTATAEAVAAFQTSKGLAPDGVAGAKTLAAINAALAPG